MKKTKKIISSVIILCLCSFFAMGVYADTYDELVGAKEEKQAIEQQLAESQQRLTELQNTQLVLQDKIVAIVDEISAIEKIINDYQKKVDSKNAVIAGLESDIAVKQAYIDDQYDKMGMRIKYMYENLGDDFFIDTLFSSGSISEVFERAEYLTTLNKYDKEMMEKVKYAKTAVEDKKADIESQKQELVVLKEAQEGQKAVLDQLKAEQESELDNIYALEAQEEAMITALNDELQTQIDIIDELTRRYNREPRNYGGEFLWPLPAQYGTDYITSEYGWREGEYSGWHAGIDVGAPTGTPIFSVADGVVVSSYYSDSAGNFTIIYHGIYNGKHIFTEYMHQSVRYVDVEQEVSAGETIGLVGNTGWSTGSHLHFGVVVSDYEHYTSEGRVDPGPYLGIY